MCKSKRTWGIGGTIISAALQEQVAALQTTVTTLQGNKTLALAPFVTVDPNPENGVIGQRRYVDSSERN
jgi:hypothetical protein